MTEASPISPTQLLEGLRAIVGEKACLDASADTQPFTTDYRKLYHGKALAVVLPATTQQVSDVLALCSRHQIPVVPQGGNTSLMGGAVPDDVGDAVVLNLRRMNQVQEIDSIEVKAVQCVLRIGCGEDQTAALRKCLGDLQTVHAVHPDVEKDQFWAGAADRLQPHMRFTEGLQ